MQLDSAGATMGSAVTGDATLDDLQVNWIPGDPPALACTMILDAGFRTTVAPGLGIVYPQGDGNYLIRMIDATGNFIGDPGVQVPESSTWAALLGLAVLGVAVWRRR